MKKIVLLSIALIGLNTINAQQVDTTKTHRLSEVVVNAIRAKKNAPFAVANLNRNELAAFSKTGQELPFLFSQTPGVLAWGENGTGTGPVYMRLRGAAGSRINVTIDGVPLNSPEDESVFWVNMNSYSALLQSAQIQRGVGTSTNGDGAFGGSISLNTIAPSYQPYLELTSSYGSFSTSNVGTNFSTGLMADRLIFDGAYHETGTDGYLHGTDGRSGSYYGGLTYLGKGFILKYKNIGNFEKTGQGWNGVVAGNDDASLMDEGIRTYKDMYKAGLGKFNNLYEHLIFDPSTWTFNKGKDGKYETERYKLSDDSLWRRTTDNFYQNHNILSAAWEINPHWTTNAALSYTYGYGYYDEFRYDNKLSKYGLPDFKKSDGSILQKTDFIRKKGLTQNTYSFIWDTNYKSRYLDITGGLALQYFTCHHWGRMTYMADQELAAKYMPDGQNYPYYNSDAHKGDYSGFIKTTGKITDWFDLFLDLQYRHVNYKTTGINDHFPKGTYTNQILDIDKHYDFFNPKAGINFHWDCQRAYASVAVSHREPERNNFTDNGKYPAPTAEKITDWEVGYECNGTNWRAGINLYDMAYHNQFVQTGELSDIGENLTTNIKKSYRMGAEITAGYDPFKFLTLEGNAALSRNRIDDFTEAIDDWDDKDHPAHEHYSKSTLSFSPSTILNGFLTVHFAGFQGIWHTNFVSRQYLDNTENRDRALPCYSQTDLHFNYTLKLHKLWKPIKHIILGFDLNNLFDRHYAAMGWVYSAVGKSSGYTLDKRYYQIGFNPMAGFNMMGHLTIRF